MARSKLTDIKQDLNTDSGSVLWSIVKGEQLEFPVTLNFIRNSPIIVNNILVHPANAFDFVTRVVEAENQLLQPSIPIAIRANGVIENLNIRIPTYYGDWNGQFAYSQESIVKYNDKYYRLLLGLNRVSSVTPDTDNYWEETVLNKVYLQFPKTVGNTWNPSVPPMVGYPLYGFFEMEVTEKYGNGFMRTWKPLRGVVELQFSPTAVV